MSNQKFTALALAALLLAGCGGSGSLKRERDALKTDLADTQAELERAKTAEAAARTRAETAEREKTAAETRATTANTRAETAEREKTAAETRATTANTRADTAEREKTALEKEAETAKQRVNDAEAKQVLAGLMTNIDPGTVTPDPGHRVAATVTTDPSTTTPTVTTGSSGKWFRTSRSGTSGTFSNTLEIYSDVEAAKPSPFADHSVYNAGNAVIGSQGKVIGTYSLGTDSRGDVASSAFPRSTGTKTIVMVDRGFTSAADRTTAVGACDAADAACRTRVGALTITRDEKLYPYRFTASVPGTLAGASGSFQCGGDGSGNTAPTTSCTVHNSGSEFTFAGPSGGEWAFRPSSGTVNVRVADAEFMHFGWWVRRNTATDAWTSRAFYGGEVTPSNITTVTGTATYTGLASGYYAMSLPSTAESRHGKFDATATLKANFGDSAGDPGTLSGSITKFRQEPGWSVTLNEATLTTAGAATNTEDTATTWTIGENRTDGGSWEAQLYHNIPADSPNATNFAATRPAGVAGTFKAEFGDIVVGRMIGAFGAHYTGP